METQSRGRHAIRLGITVAVLAIAVAGCGGKSGSTTSSSSTAALKRLDVQVVRTTAAAPSRSLVASVADLLGWPQVAEASHCTVSAGGISGGTDASEKATLLNVPLDSVTGNVTVTIACSGSPSSTVNLQGVPGAHVSVTVEVEPGKVEAKIKDQQVSSPSEVSPSEVSPSKVSQPKV